MRQLTLVCRALISGLFTISAILSTSARADSGRLLCENCEHVSSHALIADATAGDRDIPTGAGATTNRFLVQVRNVSQGEKKDDRITIRAREASLKEVLEELGRKLGIEIQALVSPRETVTVEFDGLPLREALKKLSRGYVYRTDSRREERSITKIWVLPEGREAESIQTTKAVIGQPSQPDPFKFEFDPTEFVKQAQ